MGSERREARKLDRALNGAEVEEGSHPLSDTAVDMQRLLAVPVPPPDRQRALFLSGVANRGRRGFPVARLLVPAMSVAVLIFAVAASRNALPGEQLYPLREALNAVGVGEAPQTEVDDRLHEASRLLAEARRALEVNPGKSLRLAIEALEQLGPARELLPELTSRRAATLRTIESLEGRAVKIIALASEPEGTEDEARDDRAGSETGDDSVREGDAAEGNPGTSDDGKETETEAETETEDRSGSGDGSGDDGTDGGDSGSDGSGSDGEDRSGSGSGDSGDSGDFDVEDSSGSGSDGSDSGSDASDD